VSASGHTFILLSRGHPLNISSLDGDDGGNILLGTGRASCVLTRPAMDEGDKTLESYVNSEDNGCE